jgi:S1-C subfamily serine protease
LWQAFIDSKPAAADLTAANAELKHWQEILDGDGEKVNGKWVWGAERKKLIKHVKQLIAEGNQALNNNQTLVGIAKFEQAVKEYPNNFEANFELGYFNLVKGVDGGRNNAKIDAGIKSLEIAANLRPNSAATLSDLAIGYSFRQKYQLSVQTAYKAAKIEDSQPIVQNLVNSIAWAPPGMQNNSNIKPIMQETLLLASKYGISSQAANWVWVRPTPPAKGRVQSEDDNGETAKGPPGIMGNGSGFFISSDGYIMTNRHVAKEGDYLVVRLGDGTTELAERTVVDDEIDMAVIKIKASRPMPFIQIAAYDHPPIGADVAVFGYPMFGMFGLKSSVKMTRGIVTAWDKDNELCDITVDAQVNPGNSGGPMVDHHGNLLAITSMKTFSYTSAGMDISSYGLGYSPERIRIFLKKQHDKLAPAHLVPGDKDGPILSNEELATRISPATVCILVCRGTPPKSDALGHVTLEDKRAGEER